MEQPFTNMFDDFQQAVSPFDVEAEPEDLAAMEQALSETTEAELDNGCCDMPLEDYDPGMFEDSIAAEMEALALAEPEPPMEDDNGKQ